MKWKTTRITFGLAIFNQRCTGKNSFNIISLSCEDMAIYGVVSDDFKLGWGEEDSLREILIFGLELLVALWIIFHKT